MGNTKTVHNARFPSDNSILIGGFILLKNVKSGNGFRLPLISIIFSQMYEKRNVTLIAISSIQSSIMKSES